MPGLLKMLPTPDPSNPTMYAPFQYPDNIVPTPYMDYEIGGIGLNDPSAGLEYQVWTCTLDIDPETFVGSVFLEAPNTPRTFIFSYPGITEISLTFDQNMQPFIAFFADGVALFRWFDSFTSEFTITALPIGTTQPKASLDDKRFHQVGNSDIILAYVRDGNLYYRYQQERYLVEHLYVTGVTGRLLQVGMNELNRMQFFIGQNL